MELAWYDPFMSSRELNSVQRQLDELFTRVGSSGSSSMGLWKPTSDIFETDKEYVLRAELPGVSKDNVKVELVGNTLHVSGERSEEKEQETRRSHIRERSFGKFERKLPLPQGVQEKDISADFKDGLLEVKICKPQQQLKQSSRKQIEIKSTPA